jgi:hypothetical protein
MDQMIATYIDALDEFPVTGTPASKLRATVRFAIRAPSTRNSQPWRFRVTDDTLLLYADPRRHLPIVDPADRELTISCGCALFNIRVALRHFGHQPQIDLLPGGDVLAAVRLGAQSETTEEDHALYDAIARRQTHRGEFGCSPPPVALASGLMRAAASEGAWLEIVSDENRRVDAAELTAAAIRRQMGSRSFRRELARSLHHGRRPSREGISGEALGLGGPGSVAAPEIVRAFDVGSDYAARCRDLVLTAPILALLTTPGDAPQDWLVAGEALQHVLLRGEMEGVCASFLNQAIEVPEMRPALAAVLGRPDYPQVMIRMGRGKAVGPTPRRPVEDVLV